MSNKIEFKKNIKKFNEIIEKCNKNIVDLKKQKYGKFKNIFISWIILVSASK